MYVPTGAGPLRSLNECLRVAHEQLADLIGKEIARRKEAGVPLDDGTDFAKVATGLKRAEALCEQSDGPALRKELVALVQALQGGLEAMPPFRANADWDGISLRIKPVTERDRLAFNQRLNQAQTLPEQYEAKRELVAVAVDEIVGLEGDDGPLAVKAKDGRLSDEALRVVDLGDLVEPLYRACKAYHEIEPAKKKRFGLPPPSTSGTSIADAVLSVSDGSGDATAAPRTPTDSQSRTTDVLVGTGSTTQNSESGTGSIEPPKDASGLPASL